MAQNATPDGLEADYWIDPDIAGTPEWAKELLEIDGVDAVRKLTHDLVAVDTRIWYDDTGHGGPDPELFYKLTSAEGKSLGGWSVQKVTVQEESDKMRIRLDASIPVCRAKDCFNPATHEIDNVLLDGSKFQVYACDEH